MMKSTESWWPGFPDFYWRMILQYRLLRRPNVLIKTRSIQILAQKHITHCIESPSGEYSYSREITQETNFITHRVPYILHHLLHFSFTSSTIILKPSHDWSMEAQSLLLMLMFLTLDDFWFASFGTTMVRTPFSTWALISSAFTFSGNSISRENPPFPVPLSATWQTVSFAWGSSFPPSPFMCKMLPSSICTFISSLPKPIHRILLNPENPSASPN